MRGREGRGGRGRERWREGLIVGHLAHGCIFFCGLSLLQKEAK